MHEFVLLIKPCLSACYYNIAFAEFLNSYRLRKINNSFANYESAHCTIIIIAFPALEAASTAHVLHNMYVTNTQSI